MSPSSTRTSFVPSLLRLLQAAGLFSSVRSVEVWQVLEETQEREEIIERVAALDIGKAELLGRLRLFGSSGG